MVVRRANEQSFGGWASTSQIWILGKCLITSCLERPYEEDRSFKNDTSIRCHNSFLYMSFEMFWNYFSCDRLIHVNPRERTDPIVFSPCNSRKVMRIASQNLNEANLCFSSSWVTTTPLRVLYYLWFKAHFVRKHDQPYIVVTTSTGLWQLEKANLSIIKPRSS